ncbi:cytidine deaminase-like protein [Aspergillus egyptiacus]|nr:cytidine deaminase-like protein [Aspergillus egyptiacus]
MVRYLMQHYCCSAVIYHPPPTPPTTIIPTFPHPVLNHTYASAMGSPSTTLSAQEIETLSLKANAAKEAAYCPYSKFRVGACLLTQSGEYISGANIENASYPVGTCAERVAFGTAVVAGHRQFKAIAVATDITPPASPCGMCRQLYVSPLSFYRATCARVSGQRGPGSPPFRRCSRSIIWHSQVSTD